MGVWARGHDDEFRRASPSWNQQQALQDWLCYHILCAQLGNPWNIILLRILSPPCTITPSTAYYLLPEKTHQRTYYSFGSLVGAGNYLVFKKNSTHNPLNPKSEPEYVARTQTLLNKAPKCTSYHLCPSVQCGHPNQIQSNEIQTYHLPLHPSSSISPTHSSHHVWK